MLKLSYFCRFSVYADVPKAFQFWESAGIKIYIYSSGSVKAQKLLFGHTEYGNLLPKLAGHFDTNIGMKQEKQSYENIIKEIDCAANEIMFLTDIVNGIPLKYFTFLSFK